MKTALLVLAGVLLAEAVRASKKEPGLILLCENGGVHKSESHVGSGSICVIHDSQGTSTSVGAVSVYDDSMAVP
jgi:hypothetical protein